MNSKKKEGIETTVNSIDPSQRKAAIIAGFTFLFAITIVIFSNFSINFRFIVPDEAAVTARNILANQILFRINVVGNLIYLITVIVMFTSLYIILKPVSKNFALAAAFFRLIYSLMWGIMALNTFSALRLLGDASYLPVFEVDQLQTMARLHLSSSWDAYYLGLPFWGLASLICSYLWLRSWYIPKVLAVFGIISSLWCVICAFIFIIFPNFEETVNLWFFDMPLVIFEITLGFWLLFKGLRVSEKIHPNEVN
jgi:hypothetical protein